MMFKFELEDVARELGTEASTSLKFKALDVIRPQLEKFNGSEEEDILWLFKDPVDALRGVFAVKRAIKRYNERH